MENGNCLASRKFSTSQELCPRMWCVTFSIAATEVDYEYCTSIITRVQILLRMW